MPPSPGRPPDDRRRRHEKLPVTAPNHKPTSGYVIPACQISENLTRLAALERQLDPDIDNCRVRLEQMVKQFDEDSPVATRRVNRTVPAERSKSQGDQGLVIEHIVQIIEEDPKTQVNSELVRLTKKLSEPSTQIFLPAATTPSNASESILERPEPAIGDQLDRPENPTSSFVSRQERSVPCDIFDAGTILKETILKEEEKIKMMFDEIIATAREINSLLPKANLSRSECPKHASRKRSDSSEISSGTTKNDGRIDDRRSSLPFSSAIDIWTRGRCYLFTNPCKRI